MSDTLGHEFVPGQITTGIQPNAQGVLTPVQRPSFMSAFLQNLGPALGAGLATNYKSGAAGAFGGALQGVTENQRYQQQFGLQQQQSQRQGAQEQLNAQNVQSEMADRAAQARLREAQAAKASQTATPTDEFQLWVSQHPGEPAENFWKAKQAALPTKPEKAPNTPFEVWLAQQGPNPDISKWLKLQAENKPQQPKEPAQDAFERKTGEAAATAISTAQAADFRYRTMSTSYPSASKGDQQAQLNLLANHIGMTLGLQKGARITQAILNEAQKSTPWLAGIKAKFDNRGYLSGVALTPEQMQQMMSLAVEQRRNAWQGADDAAAQAGVSSKVLKPKDLGKEPNFSAPPDPLGIR